MGISEAIVISVGLLVGFGCLALWLEHVRRMSQISMISKSKSTSDEFLQTLENHAKCIRELTFDVGELKTKQNGESLKDGLKLK